MKSKLKSFKRSRMLALMLLFIFSLFFCTATDTRAENISERESTVGANYTEAIKRMRNGFESFEESIDISDLSILPEELGRLFADATKDTPYLFYVSNNLSYSYRKGGFVVAVKPKYTMERAEAEEALEYCKGEIKKISSLLIEFESDVERVIGAHDLICAHFTYDLTLESDDLYSFLRTGSGTCQSYTWMYMAILRELGIECSYVASDTISHIWLAVRIDGEWYYSDVTWDDPPGAEGSGEISRRHLLFSDKKADTDGYLDRYGALDIKCESKKYDGNDFLSDIHFCSVSGDLDHDKAVTIHDLLLFRLYLEGKSVPNKKTCHVCADANGDYSIDSSDTETIRRLIIDDLN